MSRSMQSARIMVVLGGLVACSALSACGVSSGGADADESPGSDDSIVLELVPQSPRAGSPTDGGPSSSGYQSLRVPEVVGLTVEQARERIREAGFVSEAYVRGKGRRDPQAIVCEQHPPPGVPYGSGSGISLRVSCA